MGCVIQLAKYGLSYGLWMFMLDINGVYQKNIIGATSDLHSGTAAGSWIPF